MTTMVSRDHIEKIFKRFSFVYGTSWKSRVENAEDWDECIGEWLRGLKIFTVEALRKAYVDAVACHTSFPPTLGQLIELCLFHSGIPTKQTIFAMLTSSNLSHPLAKLCYSEIGGYAISRDTEAKLMQKLNVAYQQGVSKIMRDPEFVGKFIPALPGPAQQLANERKFIAQELERKEQEKLLPPPREIMEQIYKITGVKMKPLMDCKVKL